ncbi:MAG TPA: aminotransferase class I/II-fold pyridoxal phosphate-dependent enzyme [Candidatus Binataceae bacterium]|nr:aminotransferase class I/II-fold pyridoxal phosphate-dependent enzyme [Candidatus Binataceae bacterium]
MKQYSINGSDASAIEASAERAIIAGRLAPGDRLPTVRELAARLRVSPATVAAAYRALNRRGLVAAAGRGGTLVRPQPPLITRPAPHVPAGVRNLAEGGPDPALLPSIEKAIRRLRLEPRNYGGPYNRADLLELAAAAFHADGIPSRSIAIVSGALDGIERALAANLRMGDRVAVEDPGYPPILDLLGALGLHAEPFALDDDGPLPAEISRVLEAGVAAMIITPRAQNPTGAALSRSRVRQLGDLLRARPEVMIVEDDHNGPVAGAPALTLCGPERARWTVVRSTSKSLGPDLRLAFVAGDPLTIARLEGRQRLGPGWVSHILQQTVIAILRAPETTSLIEEATATYATRRQALIGALARHGIAARGRSGLNVWIPVPAESAVVQSMLESGWAISAGDRYRLKSPPAVRVSIATLRPAEAERLASDLASTLSPHHRTHYA